jgi:hypothetical protein
MDWPIIAGPDASPKEREILKAVMNNMDALDTYLFTGPRILQPAAIKIGGEEVDSSYEPIGGPENVAMGQALMVLVGGEVITVAAAEIDISAIDTFEAVAASKKYRCLLTVDLTTGDIGAVQGEEVDDTDDAVTPDAPEGTLGFGYVEITTAGETTFGTTALTGIATFHDLITPLA